MLEYKYSCLNIHCDSSLLFINLLIASIYIYVSKFSNQLNAILITLKKFHFSSFSNVLLASAANKSIITPSHLCHAVSRV